MLTVAIAQGANIHLHIRVIVDPLQNTCIHTIVAYLYDLPGTIYTLMHSCSRQAYLR